MLHYPINTHISRQYTSSREGRTARDKSTWSGVVHIRQKQVLSTKYISGAKSGDDNILSLYGHFFLTGIISRL